MLLTNDCVCVNEKELSNRKLTSIKQLLLYETNTYNNIDRHFTKT